MGKQIKFIVISFVALVCYGCGGSSSDSGMLIQGTLVQGSKAVIHSLQNILVNNRHEAGEAIENVQVCALGECSTTDLDGGWGFVANEQFKGGELLLSINGHGISSSLVVDIPAGAENVEISLEHHEDGSVHAHSVIADGVEHQEEEHSSNEHPHEE